MMIFVDQACPIMNLHDAKNKRTIRFELLFLGSGRESEEYALRLELYFGTLSVIINVEISKGAVFVYDVGTEELERRGYQ